MSHPEASHCHSLAPTMRACASSTPEVPGSKSSRWEGVWEEEEMGWSQLWGSDERKTGGCLGPEKGVGVRTSGDTYRKESALCE